MAAEMESHEKLQRDSRERGRFGKNRLARSSWFPIFMLLIICLILSACKTDKVIRARLDIVLKLEAGFKRQLVDKVRITLDYLNDSPWSAALPTRVLYGGQEYYIERKDIDSDGKVEIVIQSTTNPFGSSDAIELNITSSTQSDKQLRILATAIRDNQDIAASEGSLDEQGLPIAFNTQFTPVVRLTLKCLPGHDCTGVNQAPQLGALADATVHEQEPVSLTVTATDPESDTLTLTADLTGLPAGHGASFAEGTGHFTWTPGCLDASGTPYRVQFSADDGRGNTAREKVDITVLERNCPPAMQAIGSLSIQEKQLLTFAAQANEPDGEALTYSAELTGLPAGHGAAIDALSGIFRWTPACHHSQGTPYSIKICAHDTRQGSVCEGAGITVQDVDCPPVFAATLGEQSAQEPMFFSLVLPQATDPDTGAEATITLQSISPAPPDPQPQFNGGTNILTWRPGIGSARSEPYELTFRATDGTNQTTDLTVKIKVSRLAEATLISEILPGGPVFDLTHSGDYVYAATIHGLAVLKDGALVANLGLPGGAVQVVVDGNRAYLLQINALGNRGFWDNGVHVVDLTLPTAPVLLKRAARLTLPQNHTLWMIEASGGRYLHAVTFEMATPKLEFRTFDLADLQAPLQAGSTVSLIPALTDIPDFITRHDGAVYITRQRNTRIIKIPHAAAPSVAEVIEMGSEYERTTNVLFGGGRAYVGARTQGGTYKILVYDETLTTPVTSVPFPAESRPALMALQGDRLAVQTKLVKPDGEPCYAMALFDLSGLPASPPALIGDIPTNESEEMNATMHNGKIYIGGMLHALMVYEIEGRLTQLEELLSVESAAPILEMKGNGNHLYARHPDGGFSRYELELPSLGARTLVGSGRRWGSLRNWAPGSGGGLYITAYNPYCNPDGGYGLMMESTDSGPDGGICTALGLQPTALAPGENAVYIGGGSGQVAVLMNSSFSEVGRENICTAPGPNDVTRLATWTLDGGSRQLIVACDKKSISRHDLGNVDGGLPELGRADLALDGGAIYVRSMILGRAVPTADGGVRDILFLIRSDEWVNYRLEAFDPITFTKLGETPLPGMDGTEKFHMMVYQGVLYIASQNGTVWIFDNLEDPANLRQIPQNVDPWGLYGVHGNGGRIFWRKRGVGSKEYLVATHGPTSRKRAAGPFSDRIYGRIAVAGSHLLLLDTHRRAFYRWWREVHAVDISDPLAPAFKKSLTSSTRSAPLGAAAAGGKAFIFYSDGIIGVHDLTTLDPLVEITTGLTFEGGALSAHGLLYANACTDSSFKKCGLAVLHPDTYQLTYTPLNPGAGDYRPIYLARSGEFLYMVKEDEGLRVWSLGQSDGGTPDHTRPVDLCTALPCGFDVSWNDAVTYGLDVESDRLFVIDLNPSAPRLKEFRIEAGGTLSGIANHLLPGGLATGLFAGNGAVHLASSNGLVSYDLSQTPAVPQPIMPVNGTVWGGVGVGRMLYLAGTSLQAIYSPMD